MDREVRTTCGYCSTGCNLSVTLTDGAVGRIQATSDHPVNLGKACPKGFQFLAHLDSEFRALHPHLRNRKGSLESVSWDKALSVFCDRFKSIINEYGRDALAFISTGQATNEEFALLGALTRFGMGIKHADGNTRQCMATAVVAYKQSFGFDAPPFTYTDFEESDVLVFTGSNPLVAHPIMWNHVKMNKNEPKIIVIDPRLTDTARAKGVNHYQIIPKTDIILFYTIANLLLQNDWIDKEYIKKNTVGFNDLRDHVSKFTVENASKLTGMSGEQITDLARIIHEGERVSFWWMVGVNQGHQAVRTAQSIINLAILTGNLGKPGTGANSITGQCNAMGARLFSNTTSMFCGYDFKDPDHRKKVAELLRIDSSIIPKSSSTPYDRIIDLIDEGKIKGLWIICTNPVHSWIDGNRLKRVLAKLDFLVVEDMFIDTKTAEMADLVLPAGGCGEKEGTFINSERRFGVLRVIKDPPGEAKTNFEIFRKIADRWGCGELFKEWRTPPDVFQILKNASRGTPCDFTGIRDYNHIDGSQGIQWPFPEDSVPGRRNRRLLEDGRYFHKDGRARFLFDDVENAPEQPDEQYPFILITGRGTMNQWHTLTRTDRSELLKKMTPAMDYVEMNLFDAKRLGIEYGDRVIVYSRRGEAKAKAHVGDKMCQGQVFMPMHYHRTNRLTFPAFDPISRQPSFKFSAVNVKPLNSDDTEK